jgi:hypothetical protein
MHRCQVTAIRVPCGKTMLGVEIEATLERTVPCTCRCGFQHFELDASGKAVTQPHIWQGVVRAVRIKCLWGQQDIWWASLLAGASDIWLDRRLEEVLGGGER